MMLWNNGWHCALLLLVTSIAEQAVAMCLSKAGGFVQVATGGSTLTCCSMSPSSQVLAFGCQGGSVLLHGLGPTPHVSMSGAALQRPVQQPSAVQLQELQPFGLAATYPCKVRLSCLLHQSSKGLLVRCMAYNGLLSCGSGATQ